VKASVLRVLGIVVLCLLASALFAGTAFVIGVVTGYLSEIVAPKPKRGPIIIEKIVELPPPATASSANESR
jgi:hypothetical protein